ncbi:MAG: c-type cytochrome [Chloroflexi bacterium]|nr:c-type cytochrome [Chloroflexota bacterium]
MNTSKQINAMIGLLFVTFVVLSGYLLNESNRQEVEGEEITERNAERGARIFVRNCRTCHGLDGEGALGPALNSNAFLVLGEGNEFGVDETSDGEAENVRTFLRETIACGRPGTFMPTWALSFGGTLSDQQVNHLVTLMTNDPTGKKDFWELVAEDAEEADEEQYGPTLLRESATAVVLAEQLGREPTLDEVQNPDVALLANAAGRALADLDEEQREALEDEADDLPEDARFDLTDEQLEEFGEHPTHEQVRERSQAETVVTDPSALSVNVQACGQFSVESKNKARARDPFAEGTPEPTETPVDGTATATPPPSGGPSLAVDLAEWSVTAAQPSIEADGVTFTVNNVGAVAHELVLIRSDLPADGLTVVGGRVDEAGLDVLGRIPEFGAGASASNVFDVTPGNYLLICNIPAHYGLGMRTTLTVE